MIEHNKINIDIDNLNKLVYKYKISENGLNDKIILLNYEIEEKDHTLVKIQNNFEDYKINANKKSNFRINDLKNKLYE